MKNNKVLLIVAYSEKSLGTRYIANYLKKNGFEPTIIFFKAFDTLFNSIYVSDKELSLLQEMILKEKYLFVGLNIHSSFIMSEIKKLIEMLDNDIQIPFILGGVFPTLRPKQCAKNCDIVVRGDGEIPLLELAKAFQQGYDWKNILSLSYFNNNDEYIENDITPLVCDLDSIGYPLIGGNMYLIENDKVVYGDPQLTTEKYELTCMRGCPFRCFYCCSSKLYEKQNDSHRVRVRSVKSVIMELTEILEKNPNVKKIHFWDEVFNTDPKWVEEFSSEYKAKIGLPFEIWGHPLMVKDNIIGMLKDAGLYMIGVGVQSGSPNIRNNLFKRPETNEQIIEASRILSSHNIPEVYYDLMICHPLETLDELKETFDLCLKLQPPFWLQIHGLAYMPEADILKTIVERGICTEEELENTFNAPFDEQNTKFIGPIKGYFPDEPKKEVWANLIYLSQYTDIRDKVVKLSKNPYKNAEKIRALKRIKNTPETHQYIPESSFVNSLSFDVCGIISKIQKIFNYFFN